MAAVAPNPVVKSVSFSSPLTEDNFKLSPGKRQRASEVSPADTAPEDIPSPPKSSRRSSKAPVVETPPRVLRRLRFDSGARESTAPIVEESAHVISTNLDEGLQTPQPQEKSAQYSVARTEPRGRGRKKNIELFQCQTEEKLKRSSPRFAERNYVKPPATPLSKGQNNLSDAESPIKSPRAKTPVRSRAKSPAPRTPAKNAAPRTPSRAKSPGPRTPLRAKSPGRPKTPAKSPAPKTPVRTPGGKISQTPKKKWIDHVVVDRVKFSVGDDVYVKRTEEEIDEGIEVCLVCGKTGKLVECDNCARGVHLKCSDPPMKKVPEGEWFCQECEAAKDGSDGARIKRSQETKSANLKTAREFLMASKLWAARIERIWREADGSVWFQGRWFLIPEETAIGRQAHNLRRELFLTNTSDKNEVVSILRKCHVMGPEEFRSSGRDGDDVYLCEYEYDPMFQTFKRISDMDSDGHSSSDDEMDEFTSDGVDDDDSDNDTAEKVRRKLSYLKTSETPQKAFTPSKAANARGARIMNKVGAKYIPQNARKKPVTAFEKARAALRLTAAPDQLPCREREMKEIEAFVTGAVVAGDKSLGHCLYISGVPGTGKTATVMEVMQKLKKNYEDQNMHPYRFVEINGLRLTSPEHLYTVLYEALTGHHVGWKKALQLLDERFSNPKPSKKSDARPCILFVDELDLLVTRNQSVLYNIFDWPTRPHSRLFVIGIANTMDLPERLLPRIASRMGLQRVSFSPYSHEQLQTVISSRLAAINAFEKQAIEFASRKVAAVSGDARRALELCRRAVEVAEVRCANIETTNSDGKGSLVCMKDVEEAIREMFQAPHIKIMGRCSRHAKIFLVSMVYEQHKTGMVETTFEKVASTFSYLCNNNNETPVDWDTLLTVGCGLGACRLILCEAGSRHRLQKLQLNFPTDDVSFALKEDQDVSWIGKYL